MFQTLIVIGVILAAVGIMNHKALSRFFRAGSAQLGKAGRAAEAADPVAILNQEIDNGADTIRVATAGLGTSAGQVRSLKRQVAGNVRDKAIFENRIKSLLAQGDPNGSCRGLALQLAKVETDLATNRDQLASMETLHQGFERTINTAQEKLQATKQRAKSLGVQLANSESVKELAQLQSRFTDPSNSTRIGEAEEAILSAIDANNGVVDVTNSGNSAAQAADDELLRNAEADRILERFAAPTAPAPMEPLENLPLYNR